MLEGYHVLSTLEGYYDASDVIERVKFIQSA